MSVSPFDHAEDEKLAPPQPKFIIAEGASDSQGDAARISIHSRTASGNTSFQESPPITPRSLTFSTQRNSFTALTTFFTNDQNPGPTTPTMNNAKGYFPDVGRDNASNSAPRSGATSVATSVADLSWRQPTSIYGSRPGTGTVYGPLGRPSSARSTFASPRPRPLTMSSVVQPSITKIERERPKSTMLIDPSILEKPWIQERDPYQRISYFITYGVMFLGIIAGAARCYFGFKDAPMMSGSLCPVLDENFDSDAGVFGDDGKFFREIDMSGFGNGQFEMTTDSVNNSYIKDGRLYITPTLTSDIIGVSAVEDGYVYNITGCTYNTTQGLSYTSSTDLPVNSSAAQTFDLAAYTKACSAVSNATAGQIINPVQSARLTTRKTASIKYGRVEVRAKIPTGDWLWPAIWMLPVENTYGPWPISGEIDIMEARGNGPSYPKQGSNYVRGSLNWGPLTWINAVSKTYGWWRMRRGSYDQDFHTYALEWDKDFMRMYVDSRLHHLLDLRVKQTFFELGDFPAVVQNGSQAIILTNPWVNGTKSAPFDQSFYLILDLAVGGTNGWFPDGDEKPWLDGSTTPMLDFWRNRNSWLSTWSTSNPEDRSFIIDSVKMWQQC